eukprot:TRINITY_DN35237_c0_g1_i1.p1 TRINITY_DN35237_c0_g1~~TRINITY_DN35237_c0_g1_i1.p1  ORF type:complete len:279 (+),score=52.44 TRINITY_DN35237_c0_g1_i1:11-847(+)
MRNTTSAGLANYWLACDMPTASHFAMVTSAGDLSGASKSESLTIKASFLSGKTLSLNIEESEGVQQLREKIEHASGVPKWEQQIIFAEQVLAPPKPLVDYGITDGSTVLVIRKFTNLLIKIISGQMLHVAADLEGTVGMLKAVIQQEEGIPPSNQVIIRARRHLPDDQRLMDLDIVKGTTLHLMIKEFRTDDLICIKDLTGKNITLNLSQEDTIKNMKAAIQEKERIPPDEQTLVFEGRRLEDDLTLADYRIGHGSTVHLVPNLPSLPSTRKDKCQSR